MKKILLFNMASTIGGAGISFLHYLNNIDRTEYEVVVYNNANYPDIADAIEGMGIRTIRAYNSPVVFSHFSGSNAAAFSPLKVLNFFSVIRDSRRVARYIDKEKPDIIIVNSMTLFWIGRLAHKRGIRAICLHREVYPKGLFGLKTKLIKHCLDRWFSDIAFISKHEERETAATHARTCVIYDKVDLDKYRNTDDKETIRKRLGLHIDAYLVLYVGGIAKLKGAHTMIDAMNFIDNSNIKLVFLQCPEPPKKKKLKEYLTPKAMLKLLLGLDYASKIGRCYAKCKNKQSFIFKPGTPTIEDYFASCDVVVFPSVAPHQARPVYEAGAAGIPVIISDFPQTAEFVADNVTGFTFKPKDSKALAKRIMWVYEHKDTEMLHEVLRNNYSNTVKNHDTAALIEEIKSLLDDPDAPQKERLD